MSAAEPDRSRSLSSDSGRENWLRLVRNRRNRERYGPKHLRRRRDFARRLERGEVIVCPRCEGEIGADQDWDLDHDDHDPSLSYPAHRWCNRSAPSRCVTSREW